MFILVPVDKIRVGRDYQAVCPELQPVASRRPDLLADRALLVWSPTVDISEQKCEFVVNLSHVIYSGSKLNIHNYRFVP